MPTRTSAPIGSPCWADLWTSDVEGSRTVLQRALRLGGPGAEPRVRRLLHVHPRRRPRRRRHGRHGDDMPANNTWKIYLDTDDIAKTLEAAEAAGAQVIAPAMPVADLGIQAVLVDPTGAHLGAWQPGTFPGFTVLNEHGAPSWFELHTRDHAACRRLLPLGVPLGDRTSSATATSSATRPCANPDAEGELAGIMDAAAFLPEGVAAHWSIYWEVDDVDAAVAKVKALGGSVVTDAVDTPYGRLATVADPAGAQFKLRTPPAP